MVMHRKRKKSYQRLNGRVTADEPKSTYGNGADDTSTTHMLHSVSSEDLSQEFARIVSVRSLAPTAEVEEFEESTWKRNCETVIEMGEEEEEEEEEILGLQYPHERSTFSAHDLDVGHFLCGGSGLDALALEDLDLPEVEDEAPIPRSELPLEPQPPLASCSTLWDNVIHLCEIQHCAKRATSKCAACFTAFYCGDDHQRADWEIHRHHCSVYTKTSVLNQDGRGAPDGMVATKDIALGQELFKEKPLLLFPLVSWNSFEHSLECLGIDRHNLCRAVEPSCLGCNKAVEFVGPTRHRCSTCSLPLCSKSCEYEVSHKLGECQAIVEAELKVSERNSQAPCYHALYMDIEILRALRLRQVEPTQFHQLFNLKHNCRTRTYSNSTHFRRFRRDAQRIAPLSVSYAKENIGLVIALHAIIAANSFRPSLGSTFKVIFRRQAEFNHSCLPNTVHYVENEQSRNQLKMRLVTKASVGIPVDEVITIDFLPTPYLPHAERQSLLRDMGIWCLCPRCTKPHDIHDFSIELKCHNCHHGYVRPEEPLKWSQSVWACGHCFEETPFTQVNRVEKELSLQLMQMPKRKYEDIPGLNRFTQTALDSVHRGHTLIIHTWCFIESLIRKRMGPIREINPQKRRGEKTLNDCRYLLQYADTVLPHLEAIRQGLWVDKGMVLFCKFYAKFILSCEDSRRGRTNLKEFTTNIFKCLKVLDMSLQNLTPFEGMGASNPAVAKTLKEAKSALTSAKDFAATLIKQQSRSRPNLNPFTSTI